MQLELSTDQLAQVREYAGLFLSYEEIALLIDVNYDEFVRAVRNRKSDVYRAYLLGRTESKVDIRRNVINLAKKGSPQAEELAEKYMMDQYTEDDN